MAKAHKENRAGLWPAEGTTLTGAIELIGGTGPIRALEAAWSESLWREPIHKSARDAFDAALAPLLDRWNSGALIATGRPDSRMAEPVPIPAPRSTWPLLATSLDDLQKSTILHPDDVMVSQGPRGRKIFDVRFFEPAAAAAAVPLRSERRRPQHEKAVLAIQAAYPHGVPPGTGTGTVVHKITTKDYRPGWDTTDRALKTLRNDPQHPHFRIADDAE